MADEKIWIDSKILPDLHKQFKDNIKKKAKEKNWSENETKDFISGILKLYKETVQLALRENVVASQEPTPTSTSKVKQEMELLDKERAKEVNEVCARSEEILTCTIKKRKTYPEKIKESLHTKHDAQLKALKKCEDKVKEEKSDTTSTNPVVEFDMIDCESKWPDLQSACEDHVHFSKSLSQQTEKFQRVNTVAKMKLKMQDNDLNQALFSKRKLPSSFDSILETPTKQLKLDESVTDFENNNAATTKWDNIQNERLKSLTGCEKKSPDKSL